MAKKYRKPQQGDYMPPTLYEVVLVNGAVMRITASFHFCNGPYDDYHPNCHVFRRYVDDVVRDGRCRLVKSFERAHVISIEEV